MVGRMVAGVVRLSWRGTRHVMRNGSSATIAAFTVGVIVWFIATILMGIAAGLLAGLLAAGASWLAVTLPDRAPVAPRPAPPAHGAHPLASPMAAGPQVGRVIDVDQQSFEHHVFGHQVVLTVVVEAPDGVHTIELHGKRRVGIVRPGHEVLVPRGRPHRVRRAHRIDNITTRSAVTCR